MKRDKSFYISIFLLFSIGSFLLFLGITPFLGDNPEYMLAFVLLSMLQFGFIAAFLFYLKDLIQSSRK